MKIYGLIGNPLSHSYSAVNFNRKFENEGIDARYLNFELPDIGDLMELIAEQLDLCGLNVTIPYKELVMPYLNDLSPLARMVGAVNTVTIDRDADGEVLSLTGYNTDAPAFARTLAPLLPDGSDPLRALVLGTGGASLAVCAGLKMLGVEPMRVSRTPRQGVMAYADIDSAVMDGVTVIVNATPLGTAPDVDMCPDIPYDLITENHICYDLVYNPTETLFMKQSAARGAKVKNGADMLKLQALLAWRIWTGENIKNYAG